MKITSFLFVIALISNALGQTALSSGVETMRERVSINEGWRFHLADPDHLTVQLAYDVRPAPDTGAEITDKAATVPGDVLKPWILPSGNSFIKDPQKRHVRPAGDPGGDTSFVQAGFDDHAWESVTLPHDWAIKGPFLKIGPTGGMGRLPSWGVGWYRRKLDIPANDSGKSIFLDVDGAMSYATVWLNGHLVGGWPYGYASWRLDLTPYVNAGGENQLAIRLDNPPESSRWYPGGGIYRNVWLVKTQPVHIGHWGTVITTPRVSAASAGIEIKATLDNDSNSDIEAQLATEIFSIDGDGRISGPSVATIKTDGDRVLVPAKSHVQAHGSTTLLNPRLWGPPPTQQPNRYAAITTVLQQGHPVDRYETRFGIRSVQFDPSAGLLINGEHVPIQGVNNHHDLGALGAAFNTRAAERQLEILREMGCNAIRVSHNPPAPELLELTDRMGFLVLDEIFDCWIAGKTPWDFHLIFPDWHEADLRALLRRDRNCPSVILWSVGNEVAEQLTGEKGAAVGHQLIDIVHEEDQTRPATTAMNWAQPDMPLSKLADVISLNYQGVGIRSLPSRFPAFRQSFPEKVILSSETASALSSRGEYQFPVPGCTSASVRPYSGGDPQTCQVSAYELFGADFGTSPDPVFASEDQNPYVAGEFVWSGFDYLGEPTPYYSARSSYCGILDLAGFKKDRFYLYQSRWRPDLPMAHILPHWTWPQRVGQVTPVHVFTSGDEAELFLNGKSLGRKKKGFFEYRLRWDYVEYQPGELKVLAFKNGKPWASDSVKTASSAAALEAKADRSSIRSDGQDLCFVTVRVLDQNGVTVPRANNRINFTLEGPGDLIATDNGDPTSFEPFQSPNRDAFNGLCLAIVRSKKGHAGDIRVRAESPGLQASDVTVQSAAPTNGD